MDMAPPAAEKPDTVALKTMVVGESSEAAEERKKGEINFANQGFGLVGLVQ